MSPRACRDVRADLSAYLAGDLNAALTGETRGHLESCAECRSELEMLRRTVGALRALPDLPPPAAILAGVRARLRPVPWYRRLLDGRQWPLGVPVGALATVLVVVGISLFQARYPDMSRTVPREPFPKAPAPPAQEMPTTPTPIATTAPAARSIVADRQPAAPARNDFRAKGTLGSAKVPQEMGRGEEVAAHESSAVAGADKQDRDRNTPAASVERVAPTDLNTNTGRVEQVLPSRPEAQDDMASAPPFRDTAVLDAVDGKARTATPRPAKEKESRVLFDRNAESGEGLRSARLAGEKAAKPILVEAVCLLPAAGYTVEDIERLLRREGAGTIAVTVLEPQAVHEAFAPHRPRLASLPAPSQGWAVTASVPPRALTRLLDTLASRTGLRILDQPAAPNAPDDPAARLELHITVLH